MPFHAGRFFFAARPIEVAAIHPARFLEDASRVLGSELLWVWCPGLLVLLAVRALTWHRDPPGGTLGKTFNVAGQEE